MEGREEKQVKDVSEPLHRRSNYCRKLVQVIDDYWWRVPKHNIKMLQDWALAGSRNRAVQPQRLPDGPTHPVVSAPRRAGVTATGDWRATPARQYGPEEPWR